MFNLTKNFAALLGNVPEYNNLEAQLGILTPGTPEYIDAANKFAKMDYNDFGNYIEDAQYFKINELSLSYSLKDLLLQTGYNYIKDLQWVSLR